MVLAASRLAMLIPRRLECGEAENLINALSETSHAATGEVLGQTIGTKLEFLDECHAMLRAALELEVS